jgi:hypothetical protein
MADSRRGLTGRTAPEAKFARVNDGDSVQAEAANPESNLLATRGRGCGHYVEGVTVSGHLNVNRGCPGAGRDLKRRPHRAVPPLPAGPTSGGGGFGAHGRAALSPRPFSAPSARESMADQWTATETRPTNKVAKLQQAAEDEDVRSRHV